MISIWLFAEEYLRIEGGELMPTREAAMDFLNSIPDLYRNENGLYFCTSQRSAHIRNLIRNEGRRSANPLRIVIHLVFRV